VRAHITKVRRVCVRCRKELFGRSDAVYCSKRCRDTASRLHETPKIWPGICLHCGAKFFGKRGQKFCSKKCCHAGTCDGIVYSDISKENAKIVSRLNDAKRARRERLARRDAEARRALGKDAAGNVRGRIPGGCAGAAHTNFFSRWY